MQTVSDWVYVAVGLGTLTGMAMGALRWLVRSYLRELVPNGGNSMADRIRRIEDNQTYLHERIDQILQRLAG